MLGDLAAIAIMGTVVGKAAKAHHMQKNGMVQKQVPYKSRRGKTKYKLVWVPARKKPERATVSSKGQRKAAKGTRRSHKQLSRKINAAPQRRRSRRSRRSRHRS